MGQNKGHSPGFTIVELLIVIVVIGILAAITIVAYNGIQQQAIGTVLKSDLNTSVSQLAIDNTTNGTYPVSAAAANSGQGLKASPGTTYQYTYDPTDNSYCLSATSSRNGVPGYHVDSTDGSIQNGVCSGDISPGSTLVINQGNVSTFAGSTYGLADGKGAAAQFPEVQGVAVSSTGIVYVTENGNRVRQITSDGTVTTLAGSTTAGFANGSGVAAQFNSLRGIAIDSAGMIYVADSSNNRIRKITPSGTVTTYAGIGDCSDGICSPQSIAIDSSGTMYVANGNNTIYKISSGGTITFLAGTGSSGYANGPGSSAQFNGPAGIAVDTSGNAYVADLFNNRIRKIAPDGTVSTFAGSGAGGYANGAGTNAQFNNPDAVAISSSGMIYVGDGGQYIRKITPTGIVTTLAGSGTYGNLDGSASVAQFEYPSGIAVDATGVLYVADQNNCLIRKIQ